MSQELKESTQKTLERFRREQEQLEKLAFDTLNLSDTICNTVKRAIAFLEQEEKEKALLDTRECLMSVLEQAAILNETSHISEAAFADQIQNLEAIQMAVDFLCCEWEN
ncbi:hypothetical protein [Acetivibrio ethanolgignens]|uniref:Uncharacterized protein n=1 Tax=Acetivibrio ethanolgignens TaxID=290052 RepID=A0A0V8QIG2_9FIRM|nr:hypothetical protein [Acetivibrio ethanolgignens]KSV60038.1 hypothetical protein ASU35_07105 [Acetivibrio ethanolgignens]